MLELQHVTVQSQDRIIIEDLSFQLKKSQSLAIVGESGSGKSTLLKILAGVRQPSRGKVTAPKDCVVAYLPQHLMTEDGRTVFEEASQAFAHLHAFNFRLFSTS